MSKAVSSYLAAIKPLHIRKKSRSRGTNLECRETSKTDLLGLAGATWNCEQPNNICALIKARANVYEQDGRGNTCLHHIIDAAHPTQPWVVLSLTLLLRAGADPHQANDNGFTAFDIACDAPAALGSFRRDLLLQALLESEIEFCDSRLLSPTRLSSVYTRTRHNTLFGRQSSHSEYAMRKALLERLIEAIEQRHLAVDRKLVEAAFKRVLSSYALAAFVDTETVFNGAMHYLDLMCESKKEIVRLSTERLPEEICSILGPNFNVLDMSQRAHTFALLELDWFRPVDLEDLFSIYVDSLIEQLEDLNPAEEERDNVVACIDLLQNAIPSYRALSIREAKTPDLQADDRPDSAKGFFDVQTAEVVDNESCEGHMNWPVVEDGEVGERGRKESIAKTPVEYYAPKPWDDERSTEE